MVFIKLAQGTAITAKHPSKIAIFSALNVDREHLPETPIQQLHWVRPNYEILTLKNLEFAETLSVENFAKIATADIAIIVVGAGDGFDEKSKNSVCCSILSGIKNIVLLVDQQSVLGEGQAAFDNIEGEFGDYCNKLIAQTAGESINPDCWAIGIYTQRDENAEPQTIKEHIGAIERLADQIIISQNNPNPIDASLRFWVENTSTDEAGNCEVTGLIKSGEPVIGNKVIALPSAEISRIRDIGKPVISDKQDLDRERVTLSLEGNLELSRGDLICPVDERVQVADQFEALLIGLGTAKILPARPYEFRLAGKSVTVTISDLKYIIDVNSLEKLAANEVNGGDISICNISLDEKIPFEKFDRAQDTFTLTDKTTGDLLATGILNFALYRSQNVHWQSLDVTNETRAKLKGQKPVVLWFTGLSGSGKSTIANIIDKQLSAEGRHTFTLDGDNVRLGLNKDLGFTDVDRVENIRRIGEVAKLMRDAGLLTLVSFISPFRAERQLARNMIGDGEFLEIHVSTPLDVAEARDIKGLYKKARAGELKNFTGIDSPYEPPENPEIKVDTAQMSAEKCADIIIDEMRRRRII